MGPNNLNYLEQILKYRRRYSKYMTIYERWEREQQRMGDKDWIAYSWEQLAVVLSPERLRYLQNVTLGISRFVNDEGKSLGRYTKPNKKGWVGLRDRLKPFYIYKNKLMVVYVPNYNTKTGGEWRVVGYETADPLQKIEDFMWMWENWEGMKDYIGEYEIKTVNNLIKQSLRKTTHMKYSGRKTQKQTQVTDRLGYISSMGNDNVVAGGTILATSPNSTGSIQLTPPEWNDKGELYNLKSAKQLAENIWKLNDINDSTFRWVRERDVGSKYAEQIELMGDALGSLTTDTDAKVNWQSFFYKHLPLTTNEDLLNILERPRFGFLINWHNYAPYV